MSLPSVETARATMLSAIVPLAAQAVSLTEADGCWLAEPVTAGRDQPPYDASAMDGWAVRGADVRPGARLKIIGESAAGHNAGVSLQPGQAARIFTGAALPAGGDRVVIQEEAARDGETVVLAAAPDAPAWVRPQGCDFRAGAVLLEAGTRLNPWRLALAASAGRATVTCRRRPVVALLSTGDELVAPGTPAGPHQIYDACAPALAAFVRRCGGTVVHLGPARDDDASILAAIDAGAFDLLVTVGGASVGDHDRVKPAVRSVGGSLSVEGVAVRPGKPVWFALLADGRPLLGLPGNPASALVCAELFLWPLIAALQGGSTNLAPDRARLHGPLAPNGPREHYMRAIIEPDADGVRRVRPMTDQDSSLVTVMAAANGLLRRLPGADGLADGAEVEVLVPIR
ncbi:molybdopterin molybdenumtransferase MoeA [Brevundimonas intermedia]|uniref:Molybdopterin molybdenumtransferase n=1 Tax=Brevundimonas intermedia TaxID=74315 RepID=A0ABQ5TE61_9CAUL|nr:gephyrin-like molybdotransferase Glp [Brevundimonas intermedia]GLK50195.1 molybdopterin molybdenumtransferase MoeA [Brevundimonas intermedia]